jgi:hypothetical protein
MGERSDTHQFLARFRGSHVMTDFRPQVVIRLLVLGVLFAFPASAGAQTRPAVVDQLGKTYGLDSWDTVEAVRYTFNAQLGTISLARSWTWEPKTNQVTYEGKDSAGKPVKVTYLRSQIGSQSDDENQIDPGFINDQYWLILPFHIVWDTSATVSDEGQQKLPLGTGSADKIVMKYPSSGGYSVGDTWDLYLGPDGHIVEMVYHRGGPKKPTTVIAPWTGYKKAGPLLVSTDHQGTADGKPVHIFFSNVAVKLTGSDTWLPAK